MVRLDSETFLGVTIFLVAKIDGLANWNILTNFLQVHQTLVPATYFLCTIGGTFFMCNMSCQLTDMWFSLSHLS